MLKPMYKQLVGGLWALRDIIQSIILFAAPFVLFPVATLLDIHKSHQYWKNYKREPNKHVGRKGALLLQIVSTTAQVVALAALLGAYYGMPFLSVGIISAIFIGSVALKVLPNLVKTIYHGIKWACSDAGTKKNEKHKIECQAHFKSTLLLSATCVGMLAMPALPLITLTVVAVIAVKAVAATFIGLLGINTARNFYKRHQQKQQRAREWQEKYNQARAKRQEYRRIREEIDQTILLSPQVTPKAKLDNLIKEFSESEYPDGPPDQLDDKPRAYFGPNATLRSRYQTRAPNLYKDDIDDLIRSLEATDEIDGPKNTLLAFLRKSIDASLKNLNVEYECDPNTKQLELDKNLGLPNLRDKAFNLTHLFSKTESRNQLHVVLLLEALVRKKKETILYIKDHDKVTAICTPYDLKHYIKTKHKTQSVFQSSLSDPRIKELFDLVDYYMRNKDLHPETRQTYEQTWRYRVAPNAHRCLAGPC